MKHLVRQMLLIKRQCALRVGVSIEHHHNGATACQRGGTHACQRDWKRRQRHQKIALFAALYHRCLLLCDGFNQQIDLHIRKAGVARQRDVNFHLLNGDGLSAQLTDKKHRPLYICDIKSTKAFRLGRRHLPFIGQLKFQAHR